MGIGAIFIGYIAEMFLTVCICFSAIYLFMKSANKTNPFRIFFCFLSALLISGIINIIVDLWFNAYGLDGLGLITVSFFVSYTVLYFFGFSKKSSNTIDN